MIPELILHIVIDVYLCIKCMNKGLSIFRKFVWDTTNHKTFGLGLKTVDKLFKHIVFIFEDIIIFLWIWLYYIMWIVAL